MAPQRVRWRQFSEYHSQHYGKLYGACICFSFLTKMGIILHITVLVSSTKQYVVDSGRPPWHAKWAPTGGDPRPISQKGKPRPHGGRELLELPRQEEERCGPIPGWLDHRPPAVSELGLLPWRQMPRAQGPTGLSPISARLPISLTGLAELKDRVRTSPWGGGGVGIQTSRLRRLAHQVLAGGIELESDRWDSSPGQVTLPL